MLEDIGHEHQHTSLTNKSTIDGRFIVPRDHYEVDRKSGGDDGQTDQTLHCVVEQWEDHKKCHDHEETDWQQEVHLSRSVITQYQYQLYYIHDGVNVYS